MHQNDRVAWWLLLAGSAVFAATIWILPTWPFTDAPFRLAAAAICGARMPEFAPALDRFACDIGLLTPTSLFVRFARATWWPSVEVGARVWLAGYVLGFPALVVLFVRRVGGSPWSGLLVLLFVFNFNVAWGLLEFTQGLTLVMVLAHLLLTLRTRGPRPLAVAAASATLALLFWMHALLALFGLLLLATSATLRPTLKQTFALALIAAPATGLLVAWWWARADGGTLSHDLTSYYTGHYLSTWGLRKGILINDNRQLFSGRWGTGSAALVTVGILGYATWGLLKARHVGARPGGMSAPGAGMPLALFASALGCALFLPDRLPGEPAIFERFGVLVMTGAIVIAAQSWAAVGIGRKHALVIALVLAAYVGIRVEYFVAFAGDARGFTSRFLPDGRRDNDVQGLLFDYSFRGHPTYAHFPNYYIVWTGGVASTQLVAFRFYVVRPVATPLLAYHPFPHTGSYRAQDLTARYLVTRGTIPVALDVERRYDLERADGNWRLYRRRAP